MCVFPQQEFVMCRVASLKLPLLLAKAFALLLVVPPALSMPVTPIDGAYAVGTAVGACSQVDAASSVTLSNGVAFPVVSFGTAGLQRRTQQAVEVALQSGFRGLDTAQAREWCVHCTWRVCSLGAC